jgi:hypothetical protein
MAELVGAQTPDGDVIFILHLTDSTAAPQANRTLMRAMLQGGSGGVMSIDTVNAGSTLVGVVGVQGIDGGVASPRSKSLAKQCARGVEAGAPKSA